jgi:phytoene dehydrogenase-like protein
MNNASYDAIVIGAGCNGLVAANYLAKAGKRVLVLERRATAGGQLVTETFGDGFTVDSLQASANLRPHVVRELGLSGPAFEATGKRPPYVGLVEATTRLELHSDATDAAVLDSLRKFSAKDAARWPEFVAFMRRAADFLDAAYRTPMPRLPHVGLREGWPLARLLWKLRRLGGRDMFAVVRAMSMSAEEFTADWFESEAVRAAVAALAIHGVTLGSMSAGTGFTLMHNWLERGGLAHRPVAGGVGQVSEALVAALRSRGGELRTSAPVSAIVVDRQRATGVRLASGETIAASTVYSSADPRHTLLALVGARELPPEFVWQAQSIKMRGSVAKVHVLSDGRHGLPDGTLVVAPTIRWLERAYDAAKYGEISTAPYLEVTRSGNAVSIHFQFAPHALRQASWDGAAAIVQQRAIDTLDAYVPGFKASVLSAKVITPRDLETSYGLTEGDLNHGQLILDQIFFMRPLPGFSDQRTPIANLFLCGSGVHGGAGTTPSAATQAAS